MKIYWSGESKNIIGDKIRQLRKARGWTQKQIAAKMQLSGLDMTELTVLHIESGTRFVPDYEVKALAKLFILILNKTVSSFYYPLCERVAA